MTENSRPQAKDGGFATVPRYILSQELQDELILLNVNEGQYYSLNDVGSRMWVLIQEKSELGEMVNAMLQEYAVEESKLRADLLKFVDNLASQGFIQVDNGSSP